MNQLLKAIFISIFSLICVLVLVVSLIHLKDGFTISSIGLFLTAFPMLFFLGKLFLTDVARTDQNLTVYSWIVGVGFLMTIFGSLDGLGFGLLQLLSLLIFIGWVLYVGWYSIFPNRNNSKLSVGKTLIDFPLEDEDGRPISSNSFIGKKNIFLFFRGNWCPLCMAQIKEIAKKYKELEENGIQTNLISPQPHKQTRALANKYDVGFKFWVDKDNQASKALHIFAKNGLPFGLQVLGYDSDTVMPTVILTDEKGVILYADLTSNYRIRPEPEEFLKLFNSKSR